MLFRPRAWWFNKVPLSVLFVVVLLDGKRFSFATLEVLALVVLIVCAVGNYGYALNDLFDVEEDARMGRSNAAASVPRVRVWSTIVLCALCAEIAATIVAGVVGSVVTFAELGLPLAYSVPPLRIKERKWFGVAADALAAHVYPAALALLAVAHLASRPVGAALAFAAIAWALATGLRGILSHQLATSAEDRAAGLLTVVHDLGAARLESAIVYGLLPIEVCAFAGVVAWCDTGPLFWTAASVYFAYETFKTLRPGFAVVAFRKEGQPYVPFVEESFYKSWGPLVVALDAARIDLAYLSIGAGYAAAFRPHLRGELDRLQHVARSLKSMWPKAPDDHSNEEA